MKMQVYQTYVYIKTKGVGIFHDLTDILRSELEKKPYPKWHFSGLALTHDMRSSYARA
jgi:hypothetical protein